MPGEKEQLLCQFSEWFQQTYGINRVRIWTILILEHMKMQRCWMSLTLCRYQSLPMSYVFTCCILTAKLSVLVLDWTNANTFSYCLSWRNEVKIVIVACDFIFYSFSFSASVFALCMYKMMPEQMLRNHVLENNPSWKRLRNTKVVLWHNAIIYMLFLQHVKISQVSVLKSEQGVISTKKSWAPK